MERTRPGEIAHRLFGSALDNARAAASALAHQVAVRTLLQPSADDADDAEAAPGQLRVLSDQECRDLLDRCSVGRLAYIARASTPDIVPVTYVRDGADLVFCSGPGPKLQAADRRERVALEVDETDEQTRTATSVVVYGRAARLTAAQVQALGDERLPRSWASGPRDAVVRIRTTRTTGRRLT
jgi:nitroimidazol reductase NimA-like FMN-containing flavoprotein (pyridoxamine 5'-phosphate oxidase superfamily)